LCTLALNFVCGSICINLKIAKAFKIGNQVTEEVMIMEELDMLLTPEMKDAIAVVSDSLNLSIRCRLYL
jgi:hypothetical protein